MFFFQTEINFIQIHVNINKDLILKKSNSLFHKTLCDCFTVDILEDLRYVFHIKMNITNLLNIFKFFNFKQRIVN